MTFYNSVKKTKDELLTDSQLKKTNRLSNMKSKTSYGIRVGKTYKRKLRVRKK